VRWEGGRRRALSFNFHFRCLGTFANPFGPIFQRPRACSAYILYSRVRGKGGAGITLSNIFKRVIIVRAWGKGKKSMAREITLNLLSYGNCYIKLATARAARLVHNNARATLAMQDYRFLLRGVVCDKNSNNFAGPYVMISDQAATTQ